MGLTIAPSPCSEETLAGRRGLNQRLEKITNGQIQWHQCRTPQEYRDKRRNGDGFPKPPLLKGAETLSIASTSRSHEIPLRRIMPSTAGEVKGVMLHYHAGTVSFSFLLSSFPFSPSPYPSVQPWGWPTKDLSFAPGSTPWPLFWE